VATSMNVVHDLKRLTGGSAAGGDLSEEDAYELFSAMLDGGVPDLELGALLLAMRLKGESVSELLGFQRALAERLYTLAMPGTRTRPVVVPAYGGARSGHNLLPLLGLLLRRLQIPVLFHGTLEGSGQRARRERLYPARIRRAAQRDIGAGPGYPRG
jgi:anthranilate phosphoribosyltransferase